MKRLLLLLGALLTLASCSQAGKEEPCPCDCPEWAQTLLQSSRTEDFYPVLYYSEGMDCTWYAIQNLYDSNLRSGISFYGADGTPVESETLFDAYVRGGSFVACTHPLR